MRKTAPGAAIAVACCAGPAGHVQPPPTPAGAGQAQARAANREEAFERLEAALRARIAREAPAEVSVALVDLATGLRLGIRGHHDDARG